MDDIKNGFEKLETKMFLQFVPIPKSRIDELNIPLTDFREKLKTKTLDFDETDVCYLSSRRGFSKLLAWAEYTTPAFQDILNGKDVPAFTARINVADINPAILEKLIRQLLYRIANTSLREKDIYEDMLEACFVRLMEFSEPHEVLKIDSAVLQASLWVFNDYFFSSNIEKFFARTNPKNNFTMLAYLRRSVPFFDNYPNLCKLIPSFYEDTMLKYKDSVEVVRTYNDPQLAEEIRVGRISSQELLRWTVQPIFYKDLATRLVDKHSADVDWMDLTYCRSKNIFCQPSFLFLCSDIQNETWQFYLECKAKQGKNSSAIIADIIGVCMDFFKGKNSIIRARDRIVSQLLRAIESLLEDPAVKVTQEMIDKLRLKEISLERGYGFDYGFDGSYPDRMALIKKMEEILAKQQPRPRSPRSDTEIVAGIGLLSSKEELSVSSNGDQMQQSGSLRFSRE